MKKSSIYDVASLAGVSAATVSYVVNGKRKVSEETVRRVETAIEKLQYTPNNMAQSLRSGQKRIIGFIVPDIANRFFAPIIGAIESSLSQNNYSLIIANTKENLETEKKQLQFFSSGITDGIILASTARDGSEVNDIVPDGFPVVMIDRMLSGTGWDSVTVECGRAIENAVKYLCSKGHKKIGFIGGLSHISTTVGRVKSFKESLLKLGMPWDEELVRYGNSIVADTERGAEELIKKGCTAIIAGNGLMTYEMQQYLAESNDEARMSVEVIGFDESYRLTKDISFISQPIDDLGSLAAEQILTRVREPAAPCSKVILQSDFIENGQLSRFADKPVW